MRVTILYKSAFFFFKVSDIFPRLIKWCHQNAICSSLLLVRLSFSFTLSNICPRGDFSPSLIRQMVKVEHRTKTTPSRGSSHFTTYHILSLFVTLRSKSPVCGKKYATFKKHSRRSSERELSDGHIPPATISLYVPLGQRCTNRAEDFRIPVAAAADGGVWERQGKKKKETFLTRVSCFVVTRKQA